jgi:hypothetical protein
LVAESPCGLPVPVSFSERLKMLIDFALRKSAINASGFPLSVESPLAPADELFAKVRELVGKVQTPRTVDEVTTDLGVLKSQAKKWLQRLVEDGEIEECTRKPVRYRPKTQHAFKGGFAL